MSIRPDDIEKGDLSAMMMSMGIGDEINFSDYHFLRVVGGWVCTLLYWPTLNQPRTPTTCFIPEPPPMHRPRGHYVGPE